MEGNGVHKGKMKGVLWGTNKNFNRIRDFTVIGKCLYKNSEPSICFLPIECEWRKWDTSQHEVVRSECALAPWSHILEGALVL